MTTSPTPAPARRCSTCQRELVGLLTRTGSVLVCVRPACPGHDGTTPKAVA